MVEGKSDERHGQKNRHDYKKTRKQRTGCGALRARQKSSVNRVENDNEHGSPRQHRNERSQHQPAQIERDACSEHQGNPSCLVLPLYHYTLRRKRANFTTTLAALGFYLVVNLIAPQDTNRTVDANRNEHANILPRLIGVLP
jgi:hypothetical protein